MQSIGNVWVEKYVIAEEQNVARSIEMYLSRTPAAITPLGLVGNPVLKAWSNGHMLTESMAMSVSNSSMKGDRMRRLPGS